MIHFAIVQNIDEHKIAELKANTPLKIGKQIRKFREMKKISQMELALIIGKDRQYLYKIEKGKVTITIFTLSLIILALDITFEEFFSEGFEEKDL